MYIIAASTNRFDRVVSELKEQTHQEFLLVKGEDELNVDLLRQNRPRFVFFPHWSLIIPKEIYQQFECIIFHMSDVPFGRGGSPLQNLIARGIYETKISALRCTGEIDSGDVYLKRDLSLYGSAEEIYMRAATIIKEMIIEICSKKMIPVPQVGEAVLFKRRRPEEGNISAIDSLEKVFDYIRMLDAEGYPSAFVETEHLRFEFSRASMNSKNITADVKITRK